VGSDGLVVVDELPSVDEEPPAMEAIAASVLPTDVAKPTELTWLDELDRDVGAAVCFGVAAEVAGPVGAGPESFSPPTDVERAGEIRLLDLWPPAVGPCAGALEFVDVGGPVVDCERAAFVEFDGPVSPESASGEVVFEMRKSLCSRPIVVPLTAGAVSTACAPSTSVERPAASPVCKPPRQIRDSRISIRVKLSCGMTRGAGAGRRCRSR
jgi:hypothetical protein